MISQLLNTLYVQRQGTYARLDHETVVLEVEEEDPFQVPLHHLGSIMVFGNVLVSPYLIQTCGEDGRSLVWFSRGGRFKGRLAGPTTGNVLLRKAQHSASDDPARCLELARPMVETKLRNARTVLQRGLRDRVRDEGPVQDGVDRLEELIERVPSATDLKDLRGIEGQGANIYFGLFDHLVLPDDPGLSFIGRNRRPPRDPVNALLSFAYAILARDCASALEGVGLDPQVGFLHVARPGRPSLALDLIEEFRAPIADRTVLTLLNRGQLTSEDFVERPGGAVNLSEDGRATFFEQWQTRKQEEVQHPVLDRQVPYGLLPHVQARLLARTLRGDIDAYPPFRHR